MVFPLPAPRVPRRLGGAGIGADGAAVAGAWRLAAGAAIVAQ